MRINIRTATWVLVTVLSLAVVGPVGAVASLEMKGSGPTRLSLSQNTTNSSSPNFQFVRHKVGKMNLTVTNFGTFGLGYLGSAVIDGEIALSCEYPSNSNIEYLFAGALWIGAVVGRDTLVSVGRDGWNNVSELFPNAGVAGAIEMRSNLRTSPDYHPDAISEQDFICRFTDTISNSSLAGEDPHDNRPHIPLYISVEQRSYSWSYDYAEDFVLFDYSLTNIGQFPINDMYIGIYVDAVAYHKSIEATGYTDDICGFRRTVATPAEFCIAEDTVNLAWIADNDGDPVGGAWIHTSPTGVTGTRVIRTPSQELSYSFNWWISNRNASFDFGPRKAGDDDDPFRAFGSHLGTPTGDKNKYYILSHSEFDYDQLFSAIPHTAEGYLPPPPLNQAADFADGFDTRYLLSFGPFDVEPGDTLPFTIAYVGGESFHVEPRDYQYYYDPLNPGPYYEKLDFTDIGLNARWASWLFDNPGFDTNNDGDSGQYCWRYVFTDTSLFDPGSGGPVDSIKIDSVKVYFTGDGVPDFKGASPPPPPDITTIPHMGNVTIRWNGQESENTRDVFSGEKDFEGYRVYYSQDDRLTDFILLDTYDVDNYRRFQFDYLPTDWADEFIITWHQVGSPISRDSLKILYGPEFEPLDHYDQFNYFLDPSINRAYFFKPQGWNESDLTDPLGIHRVYPEASRFDSSDTTQSGFLRYYEYEYDIPNLQASTPYYFSVTTFDHGAPGAVLGALESSPLINVVKDYPLDPTDEVEENRLAVMVYPNPYRISGGYANDGYENRDRTRTAERARSIHFANLPNVCTIRIFTLTGDMVREIKHDYPNGGPQSMHEAWDVVSRNTQTVVTGIYYWSVTSEMGEQLGKLVIIK